MYFYFNFFSMLIYEHAFTVMSVMLYELMRDAEIDFDSDFGNDSN